jgi:exodeoxyribonuclease V gamma subunit
MFYLHTSNRTENLLRHLAEVVQVQGRSNLFVPELFLVQSQGMERIISQRMAESFGVWCHFKYLLPLAFFDYLAEKLEMSVTAAGFSREVMVWRLESLLRNTADPALASLAGYFSGENAELKRFQLARQLANIFDQYQIMRPDLLAAWEKGRLTGISPAEVWQAALWRQLLAATDDSGHRGSLLQQLILRLEDGEDLSGRLPSRLSIFGLHIMPPLFLSALKGLSRHVDVHLYLLSPCLEYWGDLPGRKQWARGRMQVSVAGGEEVEKREGHPLLVSLGRQGRDFQAMLLDQVDFQLQFKSFDDPLDPAAPCLLHLLQHDLFNNGKGEPQLQTTPAADDSILVVSCHSRLREIMVLKDHILDWLHRDSDLELRDIVVMAPDIQDYAALIPAVFADLQHSIADRSMRRKNPVIAAFLAFFDLLDGRFGWSEVLDLLEKDVIFPRFHLAAVDLEQIRSWVTGAGIRWGLSARQRQDLGLPDTGHGTWQAGLERLLMGYAIDTDSFVDGILPYTGIEGGAAQALGGLCEFLSVLDEAEKELRVPHGLGEWSRLLLEFAARIFADEDGENILDLRRILAELDAGDHHREDLEPAVIRAWLENAAVESRSASGFLRGQLTFCSMLPMRSIPFRKVCLIGLDDGVFPGNDRHPTFDLLGLSPRLGDRSKRDDDRYQFLEALLSARDGLYISYVGQSIRSNEKLPPSVVVSELLDILVEGYGLKVDDIIRHHPLQPFSQRYFTGEDPRLFSYNEEACRTAAFFANPHQASGPWWSGEAASQPEVVPVKDFLNFFANPQRWFVRQVLGVHLGMAEDLPEDDEPFAVTGLDHYSRNQEIIDSLFAVQDRMMLQRLQTEGRWPLGSSGALLYERREEELARFVERIRAKEMGPRRPDLPVDLEIGGIRLKGLLSNIYEGGILMFRYGKGKGRDLLHLWLHVLLASSCSKEEMVAVAVLQDMDLQQSCPVTEKPNLVQLVEIFCAGTRAPCPLYVEPGLAYVRQMEKTSGPSPLFEARKKLQEILTNGYEAETSLLLGGQTAEEILGPDFENLCLATLEPIWRRLR